MAVSESRRFGLLRGQGARLSPRDLASRSGMAGSGTGLETLEARVLLSVDPPLQLTPDQINGAVDIALDGNGQGVSAGAGIGAEGEIDVYSFVAPGSGLATAVANTPAGNLDSLVAIYDDTGALLTTAGDLDGLDRANGSATDGHIEWAITESRTYYVAVLSDLPSGTGATGDYVLAVDALATDIPVDPNTQLGDTGTQSLAAELGVPAAFDSDLYTFIAPSTGIMFIEAFNLSDPTVDPQIRIYDSSGVEIAFNDDFVEDSITNSLVSIRLIGGQNYYIVIDAYASDTTGNYLIRLEGFNGPFDPENPAGPLDDHANRDDWDNATPVFIDPTTGEGTITGRIWFTGDTDLFVFTPPTDMLSELVDPLSRMLIRVQANDYLDTYAEVYGSNRVLLGEHDDTIPGLDPNAWINPDSDAVDDAQSIDTWGGEFYYLLVRAADKAGVPSQRGLYTVTFQLAPEADNLPDAGDWEEAEVAGKISLDPDTGDGSGNQLAELDSNGAGFGAWGNIGSVGDTDLYSFRATFTGTAEIKILTSTIADVYFEPGLPPVIKTKTVSSNLDGALRIFNANREEIAYVNDAKNFDPDDQRSFDPRVVIPVVQGELYYIQVESGQAFLADGSTANPVPSVLRATGGFRVEINAPAPQFNEEPVDDAFDDVFDAGDRANARFIPVGGVVGAPGAGSGSINAVIRRDAETGEDPDLFQFISPGTGQATITVAGVAPLQPQVSVWSDPPANLPIVQGTASENTASVSFQVQQGVRYFVVVTGINNTEGNYTLSVSGIPVTDSPGQSNPIPANADAEKWGDAVPISVSRFSGGGTAQGVLDTVGDTDLFVLEAVGFDLATVNVLTPASVLDPFVTVYREVPVDTNNDDVADYVYFVRVGFDDNSAGNGVDAQTDFATTPTNFDDTAQRYYILVSSRAPAPAEGQPDTRVGAYTVSITGLLQTDDHPNLADYPTATLIEVNPSTGIAGATGIIEIETDDDLFRFVAPAPGTAQVQITTPDSSVSPTVTIYGLDNVNPIAQATAVDGTATVFFTVQRNTSYYILVDAGTTDLGAYIVSVGTPPIDDHANAAEFDLATVIPIFSQTGDGSSSGSIEYTGDTDLFRFTTRAAGDVDVNISTPDSDLNPRAALFNASFQPVAWATESNTPTEFLASFVAGAAGEVYYLLIDADPINGGATLTGAYQAAIDGQGSGDNGGGDGDLGDDDHADVPNFGDATAITLLSRTGDGASAGVINRVGDTDLFTFTTLAPGRVFVQVVVPQSGLLNGAVRVFDGSEAQIGFDSQGVVGATASLSFTATQAGAVYYLAVEQIGTNLGSYTVRVDTEPQTHFLYHPEGYSSTTIDEFIPIVNPNAFDVSYTVIARYEVGERDQVVAEGSIGANSRGGITISTRSNPEAALVRLDTPYALEIRSTGLLGATLSHYDFGVTTGENFTSTLSTSWTFAEAHRDPLTFRDFAVFYNPNDVAANLTITLYYDDGEVVTFERSVEALRRGGINFNDDAGVPRDGRFGVRIDSDQPIVAALTSYDIARGRGYGLLGSSSGGATEGVIPSISTGSGVESQIALLNATGSGASVTIRAQYARVDLPDLVRVISLGARSRVTLTLAELGLADSQIAGITYTSTAPITVSAAEFQNGDANGYGAITEAAQTFIIGDAFINPAFAGITYIENLGLYNPAPFALDVTMTYLFTDGTESSQILRVDPADFFFLEIHEQLPILQRGEPTAFSIRLDAASPFAAAFTHYDLFLGGGWSTAGAPIGLTNGISTL